MERNIIVPTNNKNSTESNSRCKRTIKWFFLNNTLITMDAHKKLDILNSAARIFELREKSHNIETYWKTIDTEKNKHRIAKFVLFSGSVL